MTFKNILFFFLSSISIVLSADVSPQQKSKPLAKEKSSQKKTISTDKKYYYVSNYEIPKEHELQIMIWDDDMESKRFYTYTPDKGISVKGKSVFCPPVAALNCIKYGRKGKLNRFAIDINAKGKGDTDLPNVQVLFNEVPANTITIKLPEVIPDYDL